MHRHAAVAFVLGTIAVLSWPARADVGPAVTLPTTTTATTSPPSTSPATSISTSTSTSTTTTSTTTLATTSAGESTTTVSDQSTFVLPDSSPTVTEVRALPKPITRRTADGDDLRGWVLADVGIAGTTTICGIVLVRRGRVPFG